MSSLLLY